MRIGIFGAGYVGYSCGIVLSKYNEIVFFEKDKNKINLINSGKSYITNFDTKDYNLNKISALDCDQIDFFLYDIFVLALPTNYNPELKSLDISLLEEIISKIYFHNPGSYIVVKSTLPIGSMRKFYDKFKNINLLYNPEFIRENFEIEDSIQPSRFIIGCHVRLNDSVFLSEYLSINQKIFQNKCNLYIVSPEEAEAIKLFSNSYLGMRIAFFNELDSFARQNNLSTKNIIAAVCDDKRIGNIYNNPSFGFGGYCLPKDISCLSNSDIQLPIISSINYSNNARAEFIVSEINKKRVSRIGIYKLGMKKNSSNFKNSPVLKILEKLANNYIISIYEPYLKQRYFLEYPIINDLDSFLNNNELILANRIEPTLEKSLDKVFTCDIFNQD